MVHHPFHLPQSRQPRNLNTSYVMVHPVGIWSSFSCNKLFKYILCYGSSILYLVFEGYCNHLNTSYVMVHPPLHNKDINVDGNLNTSYVMVHHYI